MAFTAGLISFLSPCVLPLIPGYVSFISGVSLEEIGEKTSGRSSIMRQKGMILLNSIAFICGFSIVFILLGASATWAGSFFSSRLAIFSKLAGLFIIFFGLFKMGIIRLSPLYKIKTFYFNKKKFGLLGACLIGAAFAFGWTPCIGPILGGILTYAGTLKHVNQGVVLLMVYSVGLGVPFMLTAIGINHFFRFFKRIKKYLGLIEKISGFVMVILGLMIFTNSLTLIPGYLTFLNKFAL